MEESDSSPTVFIREKVDSIFDHFAKRAALYIASAITTALVTTTGAIISGHESKKAAQPAMEINSGTNWIGQNMLQMNSDIWESRQMILDLRSNVTMLQQRLDTGETNKVKP